MADATKTATPAAPQHPQPTEEQKRTANRNALIAILGLLVFMGLMFLLVWGLRQVSPSKSNDADNLVALSQKEELTQPFHVLLIGSDTRKGTALYTGKPSGHAQVDQHSDIMTLVRVDPQTHLITLVTIPRDTPMPGGTGKINDALLDNDPEKVVDAVEQLTGTPIEYYMMVNFATFSELIDRLGGITVDVPKTITVSDPATGKNITVKAGNSQKLNGSQALALARARKEYGDDQDALRQVNVRNIEESIIRKVLAFGKGDNTEIDVERVVAIMEDEVRTNMDWPSVGEVAFDFAKNADQVKIYKCTGPYEGDVDEATDLWMVNSDPTTWRRIMKAVEAGEDPSGYVDVPSF